MWFPQNPTWEIKNLSAFESSQFRAWIVNEFLKEGILISWITIALAHKKRHVLKTNNILKKIIKKSHSMPWRDIKVKNLPKSVFRKYQQSFCNSPECNALNGPEECKFCLEIISNEKQK